MGRVRRLLVGILSLLVIASGLFFATPTQAQPASTYSYASSASCNNPANSNLSITQQTPAQQGGTLTYVWCYVPNSTYDFTLTGSSDTIRVAGTNPGQGTRTVNGQADSVTITNTTLFTQTFPATQQQVNQAESCESIGNWAWMACPLISMMSGALGWLDRQVQGLLDVDEERYTHSQLHVVWVNFRNLAYIILIPIMLVMVIGTALGFDMFSAYTVKKALPRMVVAVIFITLSWHITTFLIGFFNVVGAGILGLMTAPFGMENGMSLDTLFGASTSSSGDMASTSTSMTIQWAAILGPLVGLALFLGPDSGGLAILLFTLAPMVLMILSGFLVLLLREIFILAGVIVAPLAILSWIFPGNDKLWKSWWGLFSKLLIMFPLIMVILGAGRIAAWMIDVPINGSDGSAISEGVQSLVNPLLKLLAYVLPYMLIPMTFRYAGGVFANLAGMVNDREKGLFDRLRKARGERMKEYAHRGANQGIYDRKTAENAKGLKGKRMRATNKAAGWIFDPVNSTRIALGTEKGRAVIAQINRGRLEDSQKLSEVLSRMGFNAEELSSLSVGRMGRTASGNKFWIKAWDGSSEDLDRIANQLESSVDQQDRIGARHLRTNAQLLTQIVHSEEYGRADFKVATGLAYAAQGFATPEEIARLASEADGYKFKPVMDWEKDEQGNYKLDTDGNRILEVKYSLDTKDMPDTPTGLGGIVKTNAELLSARAGGLGKPGYGVRLGDDGTYYAPTDIDGAKIEQLVRTGVQDFSAAKGSQLSTQLGKAIEHVLTAPPDTKWINASGETKEIKDIRTGVEATLVQVMGSYAAPDVKRRVYDLLVKSKKKTLIGTTRNIRVVDPSGNPTVTTITIDEKNVAEYAEADIQALLSRSSGAIDPAKLGMPSDEEGEKK